MADASLRGQLLRLLLLPVAGILAVSSVAAYYLAREPATDAYDGALIDAGIALADRIHVRDGTLAVDLPSAAEQILRTDQFDTIYYLVRDPSGKLIDEAIRMRLRNYVRGFADFVRNVRRGHQ